MATALRREMLLPLLCVSLLAGCDMAGKMKESLEHSGPIETEIEQQAGVKTECIQCLYRSSAGSKCSVL